MKEYKMQSIKNSTGCLMTLEDFKSEVDDGGFIDGDGYGYLATTTEYTNTIGFEPSEISTMDIPPQFTHVLWFNK